MPFGTVLNYPKSPDPSPAQGTLSTLDIAFEAEVARDAAYLAEARAALDLPELHRAYLAACLATGDTPLEVKRGRRAYCVFRRALGEVSMRGVEAGSDLEDGDVLLAGDGSILRVFRVTAPAQVLASLFVSATFSLWFVLRQGSLALAIGLTVIHVWFLGFATGRGFSFLRAARENSKETSPTRLCAIVLAETRRRLDRHIENKYA